MLYVPNAGDLKPLFYEKQFFFYKHELKLDSPYFFQVLSSYTQYQNDKCFTNMTSV